MAEQQPPGPQPDRVVGAGAGRQWRRRSCHERRAGQLHHRGRHQDADEGEELAGTAHTGHHRTDHWWEHPGDSGRVSGEEAPERHQLLPEVAGGGGHASRHPGHADFPHQHPLW